MCFSLHARLTPDVRHALGDELRHSTAVGHRLLPWLEDAVLELREREREREVRHRHTVYETVRVQVGTPLRLIGLPVWCTVHRLSQERRFECLRKDAIGSEQGWHLGRPLGPLRLSHPRRALGGLLSTCISRACHLARTLAPLPSIAHTRNTIPDTRRLPLVCLTHPGAVHTHPPSPRLGWDSTKFTMRIPSALLAAEGPRLHEAYATKPTLRIPSALLNRC